jgi:predicted  nucleic acid-binding Zn-ribbon protein
MPLASGSFVLPGSPRPTKEKKMPQRTKLLYMLQRIDTQLARKKRRYRQVQEHLDQSEGLQAARVALEAAEAELSKWRAKLRDCELEAGGVAAKLEETQQLLYGGTVTNPKELSDLQRESEYLKRRQDALEERQLEEMMTVEQLTSKAAIANEEHIVVEAAWRSENAELHAEYDTLRQDMAKLLSQRKTVVKHISAKDLDEYDALRRLRKGVAVVAVKDDTCQVCHVQVPHHDMQVATNTDQIAYCSGCERILYVPEG